MIGPLSHQPSHPLPALPNPEAYASAISKRASQAAVTNEKGASAQTGSDKADGSQNSVDSMERNTLLYFKALKSSNATAKLLRHLEKK